MSSRSKSFEVIILRSRLIRCHVLKVQVDKGFTIKVDKEFTYLRSSLILGYHDFKIQFDAWKSYLFRFILVSFIRIKVDKNNPG